MLHQPRVVLGLIVRRSTDAVKLLAARSLLAALAVAAHKVLQLLGLFLCNTYAGPMEPVGAQVTANIKPRKVQIKSTRLYIFLFKATFEI